MTELKENNWFIILNNYFISIRKLVIAKEFCKNGLVKYN